MILYDFSFIISQVYFNIIWEEVFKSAVVLCIILLQVVKYRVAIILKKK